MPNALPSLEKPGGGGGGGGYIFMKAPGPVCSYSINNIIMLNVPYH